MLNNYNTIQSQMMKLMFVYGWVKKSKTVDHSDWLEIMVYGFHCIMVSTLDSEIMVYGTFVFYKTCSYIDLMTFSKYCEEDKSIKTILNTKIWINKLLTHLTMGNVLEFNF